MRAVWPALARLVTLMIWRADLLVAVIYPDAQDAADQVTYAYNRQGQVIVIQDQNGTIHNYLYDLLGRLTDDSITTFGPGVDGTVGRIHCSYEAHGLVQNITSYNSASGGSVVNDVENLYNGFLQLIQQYQEHGGAVNIGTSLSVQCSYASGSANTIRPTGITYPNGRAISYNYNAGNDDALSRVSPIPKWLLEFGVNGVEQWPPPDARFKPEDSPAPPADRP